MSEYNASQNTMKWQKNNPEKFAEQKKKRKERESRLREDAVKALGKTKHKTPLKAIKAFCNNCSIGISRSGYDYAPVECSNKTCHLYAFRNLNANIIGNTDMSKARKARNKPA